MPGLPATGTLSYNGYTFDGASHVDVQVFFEYDDSQTTIIAHRHVIHVQAIIGNDSTSQNNDLDADILNIRGRLGESGKTLIFTAKGFGNDLSVAGSGGAGIHADVHGGPFPKMLSWLPIGDDKACEIEWTVETTVPICPPGKVAPITGVMSVNYGIDYSIDVHGDTTRVISGYLQIRKKAGQRDTADRYRDNFQPALIPGFQREQTWSVSPNRRRITFTIVDREIPSENPYPLNTTAIQATHRSSWSRNSGTQFINTITATIRPESNINGSLAWAIFRSIVIKRMQWSYRRGRMPFLLSLDVEEDLFGREHSFQASYRLLTCIRDFVQDSGLWRPLGNPSSKDNEWQRWAFSLKAFSNRGNAKLFDAPEDHVIVNLCDPAPSKITPNAGRAKFFQDRLSGSFRLTNELPPRDQSWLEYESTVIPYRRCPTVRQSILQSPPSDASSWNLNSYQTPGTVFGFFRGTEQIKDDVIQEGGAPRYSVRYVGRAKRAGYQIARPRVDTVGDKLATETQGKFMQRTIGNFFGQPVYEAWWSLDYMTTSSPGVITSPSDIAEWVDGSRNTITPSPGQQGG